MIDVKKLRMWVIGAAVGLIAAMLIVPTTRGLFLLQLRLAAFGHNSFTDPGPIEDTADKYPNDFQIQIAAAHSSYVKSGTTEPHQSTTDAVEAEDSRRLTIFRNLEDKFPDNPSVYANVLRFLSDGQGTTISRPENWVGNDTSKHVTQPAASKAFNAFYDRTASIGEQLDPNNAYFPLMRAVGLFGDYKDSSAMAEIHRAARDTIWQEYYQDEVYGMWKVNDIQQGTKVAMLHAESSAAVLFPQYALLRGMARIALYKAMLAERSGDVASGISIRMDLIRSGSLMRAQSGAVIGSLVGIAISSTSMSNVGGTVKKYKDINTPGQPAVKAAALKLNDYCAYLEKHGYAVLIPSITQEYQSSLAVRKILSSSNFADVELQDYVRSVTFLTVDLTILSAISILLLAAVLCTIVLNRSMLESLPPLNRFCILLAVFAAALVLGIATTRPTGVPVGSQEVANGFPNLAVVQFAELIAAFVVMSLTLSISTLSAIRTRSFNLTYIVKRLCVAAAACGAIYLVVLAGFQPGNPYLIDYLEYMEVIATLLLICLTLARSVVSSLRSTPVSFQHYFVPLGKTVIGCAAGALVLQVIYFQIMRCYSVALNGGYVLDDSSAYSSKLFMYVAAGVLAPVLCLVLVYAGISLKSWRSMPRNIADGMSRASIPMASLLVLIYGGCLLYTIKQDSPHTNRSAQWLLHEGPSWAKFCGAVWPGAVNWPDEAK